MVNNNNTNHGRVLAVPAEHPGGVLVSVVNQNHVLLQLNKKRLVKNRMLSIFGYQMYVLITNSFLKLRFEKVHIPYLRKCINQKVTN